jgi:Ricin-type beta-trefoil lectin domain
MRAIFTSRVTGPAVIAVAMTAIALVGTAAQAAPRVPRTASASAAAAYTPPTGVVDPCPPAAPADAGCAALIKNRTAASASASASADATTPGGYSPANLQQAYDFQGTRSGSGQTVAVVTAYNDPDAASDLAAYRTEYGLTACTVADECFKQVSETGSTTSLPGTAAGWTAPAAESIEMISAICPNCQILLVEASSTAISDLGAAENEAVTLGASFVDNDWIIPEASVGAVETTYDTEYFDHPGVAITAPAGDDGYGVINYPAASQYVTAVGGSTLTADSSVARGYTEAAWAGSSAGCSAYEPKPSWQTDAGCADRTLNDLAAVADPNTPIAYYDTPTEGGWGEGSGTVVSAAIVAASYALAGTPAAGTYPASYPYESPGGSYTTPGNAYASPDGMNNITSGSDGTCSVSYLCTAGAGYNGPTGLGSPNTALSLTTSGETGQFQVHVIASECMDDADAGTAAGTKVDIYNCNGTAEQNWTAHSNGTITDTISGKTICLDVAGGGTASGTLVESNPCSGATSQQWGLTSTDEIINGPSGLCLTDPATADGTQLKIETCASTPVTDQQWSAPDDRPTASGAITSQITTAKLCVDDASDSTTNDNKIQIYACLGDAAQDWTIESNGQIEINGKCMATDANGTSNGTTIVLYTCEGDTNAEWAERSNGTVVNIRSGTCLDDPSATTTNGTQLQIWACDGDIQQQWNLP